MWSEPKKKKIMRPPEDFIDHGQERNFILLTAG